jgi:hypothetical protein
MPTSTEILFEDCAAMRPHIDLVRSQDVLPDGAPDLEVIAWAASEKRVLITNDRNSLLGIACKRVADGEYMPGVIATTDRQTIGDAIIDILTIAECMSEDEIKNVVLVFLPYRG